jgi:hypothetical protein
MTCPNCGHLLLHHDTDTGICLCGRICQGAKTTEFHVLSSGDEPVTSECADALGKVMAEVYRGIHRNIIGPYPLRPAVAPATTPEPELERWSDDGGAT